MITSSICKDRSTIRLHITSANWGECSIVGAVSSPADAVEAARFIYEQIAQIMIERRIEIVHERIFGSLSVEPQILLLRKDIFQRYAISNDTPVTYIQGNPPWGEGLAGVIIHAVLHENAQDVWTIMDGDVPCGRGWRSNGLTYLVLQNIQAIGSNQFITKNTKHHPPLNPLPSREGKKDVPSPLEGEGKGEGERIHTDDLFSMSRPAQARLMIERAGRLLRENGASYRDVVRTWFYLSDILDWYAAFNKARNEKYGEFGIMPGPGDSSLLLPASTGIQGETPSGAACAMDLLAVIGNNENGSKDTHLNTLPLFPSPQGRGNDYPSPLVGEGKGEGELLTKTRPSIRRLTNPSQLDAFRYGSAFARASVVKNGSTDIIEVSGTAAIDEYGVSLYPGDIRAQIDCTFDKVQALLEQAGAGLGDICSATVFIKQPEFAEIFYEMASARGIEDLPCICIVADVCREELLFEMDAEVIVQRG